MKKVLFLAYIFILTFSCKSNKEAFYPNQARFTAKSQEINYNTYTPNDSFNTYTTKFSIYFDHNTFKLSSINRSRLDEFIFKLTEQEKTKIYYIEGNTDSSGSENYNMNLSKYRAESVKEYLVTKGFSYQNLLLLPKGESNPIANNSTQANLNRRVSIYIKKR